MNSNQPSLSAMRNELFCGLAILAKICAIESH